MAKKKKYDYFKAYVEMSDLALKEADILINGLETYSYDEVLPEVLDKIHKLEHAGDLINHEIYQHAAIDFMPPIDREDIVELAQALDLVIDGIEDVMLYFYMYNIQEIPEGAIKFARLMQKSCEAVDVAMKDFHNFKKNKAFKQFLVAVNDYEEESDKLFIESIRDLHVNHADEPLYVMVWSRVYNSMEDCCDACEHVAKMMSTILLKNM